MSATPTGSSLRLSSDIASVGGIGEKLRVEFTRLGIVTVGDLLKHLPLRYERHRTARSIAETERAIPEDRPGPTGEVVTVEGELASLRVHPGRRHRIEATLDDGTGTVRLVWFNSPWLVRRLHAGAAGSASGKVKRSRGYLEMTNPTWAPRSAPSQVEPGAASREDDRLRPVYPASEELASSRIERAVAQVLHGAVPQIVDAMPPELRSRRSLIPLPDAYRTLHEPGDEAAIATARRRLAYDELFLLQLGVMLKRAHLRSACTAPALRLTETIDARIRARLPFALTADQDRVCAEIARDMATGVPMNRLLQGDVGSGKTAVAAYACLLAIACREQAAIMAPTEILAEQHHASLVAMLASSEVRIELLTGGRKGKARAAARDAVASGEAQLVVGTHALLSQGVQFRSLALAVIDEQHRFGVAQRAVLRAKRPDSAAPGAARVPHTLVMTATPIPRTLALTVFGDLDVSTIRSMPPGRLPVTTRWLAPTAGDDAYHDVAARIARGERAFVVVPAIDESDAGLADVSSHLTRLSEGPLRGARLAAMHGRLPVAERDAIMASFRRGEIDALVATTVIEVGVDVPEATVIVIEHADRFGLAQLHQLRGRVGRGSRRGACYLIAEPLTDEGRRRLEAMVATGDGFRLAELDLEIRGPGEFVGSRQSGLPPFRVADLTRDLGLLRDARDDAADLVAADARLSRPDHALLKRKLLATYGESLGLVDVG